MSDEKNKDEQLEMYAVKVPHDGELHDVLHPDTVELLSVFPAPKEEGEEDEEAIVVLAVRDIAMPPGEKVQGMSPLKVFTGTGPIPKGAKPVGSWGWATVWQVPRTEQDPGSVKLLTPQEGNRINLLEHMSGGPVGGIGGALEN